MMKIIKLSQGQQFQLIQQSPNSPANFDVQTQNLQSAQAALAYFRNLTEASQQAESALRNLEEQMGMDLNLTTQFQGLIRQAISSSPAFNLLAQMNFVSSVDSLLDANQISSVETIINNNLQGMKANMAPSTY